MWTGSNAGWVWEKLACFGLSSGEATEKNWRAWTAGMRKERQGAGRSGAPEGRGTGKRKELFDFDLGSGGFDLLLDLFGFGFGDAALEHLGGAFDEGLGFGEAETGDGSADFLNDGDLVRAAFSQDDIELGLFFFCFSNDWATTTTGRSGGADAPLFFEGFDEFGGFEDGESAEAFNDFC